MGETYAMSAATPAMFEQQYSVANPSVSRGSYEGTTTPGDRGTSARVRDAWIDFGGV